MSTVTFMNYDEQELEDLPEFEKMRRSEKVPMPAHRSRSAINASRKSPRSKSMSRKFNRTHGGANRRGQRSR